MYDQKKERNFCLSHKHTSWKDIEQNIPRVRDWLEDVISSAQVMPTCSVFSIIFTFSSDTISFLSSTAQI